MNINRIILGTVQMGLPYGVNNQFGKVLKSECFKILSTAYKTGIRTLDSAEVYGNAHKVIGDFHRKNDDKTFKIFTKIPALHDLTGISERISQYLFDLKINKIDGLMFHSFISYKKNKDIIPKLLELKNNGTIINLGVSAYTNDEVKELIIDDSIDLIQLPFNLLDNFSVRGSLLQQAKQKGKIIHTRSVFLQGLFFMTPYDNHPIVKSLRNQMLQIKDITNRLCITVQTLAIAYCLNQSMIDQILIGVDSQRQLKENIEAFNYQIPEDIVREINQIKTKNTDLLNPSLWN
jgi:aryl-alcohol dehydrogenase-like predicted oxidoreductase